MATQSSMRPPKGGNIKKGVCQNHSYLNPDTGETGDCPKCASGEVQYVNVQHLSDFKCSVCRAKLTPVKSGMSGRTKGILFGALGLVIAGGGIFWGLNSGGSGQTPAGAGPDSLETVIDSLKQGGDSLKIDTVKTVTEDIDTAKRVIPKPTVDYALGGRAKIVKENGYSSIVFLRDYTLDLGKSDGRELYIRSGERIERADIRHNVLRGGDYVSRTGENIPLKGLNVRLR